MYTPLLSAGLANRFEREMQEHLSTKFQHNGQPESVEIDEWESVLDARASSTVSSSSTASSHEWTEKEESRGQKTEQNSKLSSNGALAGSHGMPNFSHRRSVMERAKQLSFSQHSGGGRWPSTHALGFPSGIFLNVGRVLNWTDVAVKVPSYHSGHFLGCWLLLLAVSHCAATHPCGLQLSEEKSHSPRSMKGGDLHWIWKPYELYQEVDYVGRCPYHL